MRRLGHLVFWTSILTGLAIATHQKKPTTTPKSPRKPGLEVLPSGWQMQTWVRPDGKTVRLISQPQGWEQGLKR